MTGQFVRQKIEEAGLSVAEVASRLQVSPKILNQQLSNPDITVSTLVTIAKAIGKQVSYFIEELEAEPSLKRSVNKQVAKVAQQKDLFILDLLRKLLEEKNQTITAYRETIQVYEWILKEKGEL